MVTLFSFFSYSWRITRDEEEEEYPLSRGSGGLVRIFTFIFICRLAFLFGKTVIIEVNLFGKRNTVAFFQKKKKKKEIRYFYAIVFEMWDKSRFIISGTNQLLI